MTFEKEFNYSDSNETVKAGDRITIELDFPEKLAFVGRADKVLEKLIKENNGTIKKNN
ncbi:hypothetical protein GCM10007190_08910 [Macrococcus hajekii]|uniref:hypothetical protein n=1 Tax=Macrococcus hajekii TaxID=198482 RepID=UPI00140C9E5C|nr:hypothetical protein [Macrococcus hajekii]GGB03112.1 hypothetical protein GCM10007190_08910 [Macrococcus hajekii]